MQLFQRLDMIAKIGIGLVMVAIVIAVMSAVNHFTNSAFDAAEEAGAANVRVIVAKEGLSNVKSANEAAAEVRRDPVMRNADCVRDSRTPENC